MNDDENPPQDNDRLLGNDGEYTSTRDLTSQEVLLKQWNMLADQDKDLDEIAGITQNMKEDGRMIGEELVVHNEILGDLHQGIDWTQAKMIRVDNSLKKLIASSNQCCLWLIIIVEIIALILIFVLM